MKLTPIEAVTVETKKIGAYRVITSLEGMAKYLLEEWPAKVRKATHVQAQMACLAAMEGTGTLEEARSAFIRAAEDADVLRPTLQRPRKG